MCEFVANKVCEAVVVKNFSVYLSSGKHYFLPCRGSQLLGLIKVPGADYARISDNGKLLIFDLPSGDRIRISAADACEQATVGGCGGLGWLTEVPEQWKVINRD